MGKVCCTGQPTLGPRNSSPTANDSNVASPNELLHLSYFNIPVSPPSPGKTINSASVSRLSTRLCLLDNGNLMLVDRQNKDQVLWESFKKPTDTFLPGMTSDGSLVPFFSSLILNLNLTSWQNHNNPAKGNFTFLLQPGTSNKLAIFESGDTHYWENGSNPFDKNASALSGNPFQKNASALSGNPSQKSTLARLVMNFTGQIQFWKWENKTGWSLIFSEPKDRCSLYNGCGDFGSCNSNNAVLCKCLPGFEPSALWKIGKTSGGCSPRSGLPNNRKNSSSDIFLPMPMMTLGNGTCSVSTNENCTAECLKDSNCVAYSFGFNCPGAGTSPEKRCLIWRSVLDELQEESPDGITIFVRTTRSDIEPISRACKPCGTYIIPYPLSTAANCGDPSYFSFKCNATTGQVYFSTGNLTYKVTSFDPVAKIFTIQVGHGNSCGAKPLVLSPMDSLQYKTLNCNIVKSTSFLEVEQSFIEVEVRWKPPSEPACNAPSDCHDWPHTSCKTRRGKMSCICGSRFHWDGRNLSCNKVINLKVVIPCIAGALAIIFLCGIFFIYRTRKRRPDELQGFVEFQADDTDGIDVPFFDWEIILAATNNFAEINKLGTGGFGSVYRGKLPDGREIAVKRLSSVSVQGLEEFRTEVKLIAKLQHRNLVRLIGYCMKADEKILVYEYMPNGSLDSCLFDEKHCVYLDWKKRFDIILGIARGLLYLHQDSRLRIIHRDLKPSNILLDEELNPKISDFGIARIVGGKETQASTNRVVGTYGYMSPEYASDGIFSVKSDVFSFGVVILETISGRRNSKIFMFEHGLSLLGHAWKLWNEDKGLELMDPKLNESCLISEVLKCIHIGLLCVQEDPSDRPTMSTVVHMLSGENASLPLAKQPAFMNRKPLTENASTSSAKDSSVHEVMTVSTVGR